MLKKDLAYRKSSKVNWDPVDHTVLANEQVIDGRGWRSGALVEQRELTQWFFKITKFSDDLLEALGSLDKWPEKVRLMQANWIGRSEGLMVRWALGARDRAEGPQGAGGLHHAARHAVRRLLHGDRAGPPAGLGGGRQEPRARRVLRRMPAHGHLRRRPGDRREEGLRHRHQGASTRFDPEWQLPVYVANFILMDYGTGAIFGCPSGDQRDLEFARKYGLPVVPVVAPKAADAATLRHRRRRPIPTTA